LHILNGHRLIPLTDGLPGILKIDFTQCERHSDVGNNDDKDRKTRFQQPNIDRCLDIDEPTSDTPPQKQSNAQQGPLEYGRFVDAHRLAAVSAGGGWWNSTTQELIPILREDDPNYRQNEAIIAEAIRRWNGGSSR
jgi:hypothetical protein